MNRFISDEVDPAVLSGGFGKVVELKAHRSLTDHEKHVLLTQHFIPSPHYKLLTRVLMGASVIFSTVGCLSITAWCTQKWMIEGIASFVYSLGCVSLHEGIGCACQ